MYTRHNFYIAPNELEITGLVYLVVYCDPSMFIMIIMGISYFLVGWKLQACQTKTAYFSKMSTKKQVLKLDSTFSLVLSESTKQQTAETKQGRLHLHFAPKIIKIH